MILTKSNVKVKKYWTYVRIRWILKYLLMSKKVSVIMANFNSSRFISKTIESEVSFSNLYQLGVRSIIIDELFDKIIHADQ